MGHLSVVDRAVPWGNRAAEHGLGDLVGQGRDRISRGKGMHRKSSVTTAVDGFCSRGCTEPFAEGLRAELFTQNV